MARRREAAKAQYRQERASHRGKLGRLRDRVVSKRTLTLYKKAVAEFFRWCRREGLATPPDLRGLDCLLSEWAECLWQEGEARALLNRGLCGIAHLIPPARNKVPGTWRLYQAWCKSEPRRQAPPVELLLAQAIAGILARRGFGGAAICVLLAHDCILRNAEAYELRTGDCIATRTSVMLTLRDTKIGQRLGVTQIVVCQNRWLAARVRHLAHSRPTGSTLLGIAPTEFRKQWQLARKTLSLPDSYTPYGLRRGGATSHFRETGSFDKVCDRGRWGTTSAARIYVTTALQHAAELDAASKHLLWRRWAGELWSLPA